MTDIAPELIQSIIDTYRDFISKSEKYARLRDLAEAGKATYVEAHKLAIELGDALAKSYKLKVSSSVLPDGRMYYNIAERLLSGTLKIPQETLSEYCVAVQEHLNQNANIGMKAAVPEVNQSRIDGIVERLSNETEFDNVDWILDDPIKNLLQSQVDDFVKANADIQKQAGMWPKIVRTSVGKCCKWCRDLAGTYDYPVDNEDVYRRHENCRCMVTYVPTKGKRQNVWTKIQY